MKHKILVEACRCERKDRKTQMLLITVEGGRKHFQVPTIQCPKCLVQLQVHGLADDIPVVAD